MWKKEKKQETQEVSPEKEEGRDLYEWAQALVCSVLAVVLLFTFVIRLIGVDGHSMVPTLQDGDRLLAAYKGLSATVLILICGAAGAERHAGQRL